MCQNRPLGSILVFIAGIVAPALVPSLAPAADRQSGPAPFTQGERTLWSLQPVRNPIVPKVAHRERVHTPIDAFVLKQLETRDLSFSPPASRRELIRRATFDLLGLPPSPQEIEEFAADPSRDAYERLVDRLLANPHYGEAWGRTWLDLVRFAETAGYNADPVRPLAWKYRDYVVRAFNADMPYDRFMQQQIAGDELFPDDVDAQIATGYLRMWPDESNASVVALARQDALNDLTGNVGAVFLGLSIGCAQCHDHKFDPIRQHDFYRLQAFFSGIVPVEQVAVGSADALSEYRQRLDQWSAKTRAARHDLHRVVATARAKAAAERRKRFPPDVLAAIDKAPEDRTALERQFFFWSDRQITVSEKELLAKMSAADRKRLGRLRQLVADLEAKKPIPPISAQAMAATEIPGPIPPTFLLAGGSYNKPIREVRPGYLSALFQAAEPAAAVARRPTTSGRRSALAGWLADPNNPLVPRVIVNRIWQGHLGRGLIDNANDFGTQSPPPSHPELLDWMTGEFIASGWSIKSLHRLILTSEVYRQATDRRGSNDPVPRAAKIDGENRLYWHFERRRLSAERIRDAILAVSGRLNETMEGPSVRPPLPKGYARLDSWKTTPSQRDRDRRSVYIFAKRNLPYPLLKAFDLPDMHESCARRTATIIAPQALALWNDEFVLDCGDALARRIVREQNSDDWKSRITAAYRFVFGRPPDATELAEAGHFLKAQSAHVAPDRELLADEGSREAEQSVQIAAFADLCHTLLNANEFLFLE